MKVSKANPIRATYTSKPDKWSITQDLTVISNLPKHNSLVGQNYHFPEKFHYEHAHKVAEVRHAFNVAGEDSLKSLEMIDALQRLGIDYHFEREIKSVLERQYVKCEAHTTRDHDLYEVALSFRLMRQEGYNVSEDVFTRYKNRDGRFKPELGEDIKGLVSLYEASQLVMEKETLLDDARKFSEHILKAFATDHQRRRQARLVENTLIHPHHKSLARFNAENVLKGFVGRNQTMNLICELASLDFRILRSIHQNEVVKVSKWWNELGLSKELKFARDQPVKWYMWPMATINDPTLAEERLDITKPISLVYIIDDIFDVRGTVEELSLFTDVVNTWDYAGVEKLPDYMKLCFNALNDITNEISCKIMKKHGQNPTECLRKSWATLCNAFLWEAKWFASGRMPKAEEYLRNGIISTGVPVILTHLFILLGGNINTSNVELWNIDSHLPGLVESTAKICRLWDDLGSAKDENQDGKDGSYLDCYIKEHEYLSIETAKEDVNVMISEAWKRLNREAFSTSPFCTTFIKSTLNVARMIPVMYNYDKNHRLPVLEKQMKSLVY